MILLFCLSILSGLLPGVQQPATPSADHGSSIHCSKDHRDLLICTVEGRLLVSKTEETSGTTVVGDLNSFSISYNVPSIHVVSIQNQQLLLHSEDLEVRYRKLRL